MPKKQLKRVGAEDDKESEEEFNEADLSDDEEARKRRRRRPQDGDQRKKILSDQFTPHSLRHLRACVFCKLVLNQEQWKKYGMCPNCPDSLGEQDSTDCFESLISLILPKKSWVAEWQKMQNMIPGLYAMSINPSGSQTYCKEDDDEFEDIAN